jgi:hypothetical protein
MNFSRRLPYKFGKEKKNNRCIKKGAHSLKLKINAYRCVCAHFLAVREAAKANGQEDAAVGAYQAFANYRELLNAAYDKRLSGLITGQPSQLSIYEMRELNGQKQISS